MMLKQNYAMDFMAKTGSVQQASFDFKKSENVDKTGFPQFKDVLSGTINKPQAKVAGLENTFENRGTQRNERNEKTEKKSDANSSPKPQFRSYREIKDASRKDTSADKVENKASDTSTVNSTDEVKSKEPANVKTKEEVAVDTLAEMMGISADDLVKLLKIADIKPEELTSDAKVGAAIDKLSDVMNLTDEQKNVLGEVINNLRTLVEQYPSKEPELDMDKVLKGISDGNDRSASVKEADNKEGWVKVNNENITVIDNSMPLQEFQEIMAKMKAKLGELAENLQKNPLQFRQDMLESIKASLAQVVNGQEFADTQNADSITNLESKEVVEDSTEKDLKSVNEAKNESGSQNDTDNSSFAGTNTTTSQTVQVENGKASSENSVQFNNLVEAQSQKNNVHETAKVSKPTNVPKSEIIEQVVHKAKVVFTAEKSEMVMDLKPESLGKLSLKVVTEHGMVVAKFVAESQQVKEALETNMQLLKDSLEKQGLSVQGFSVSVRQDSGRSTNNGSNFEAEGKKERSKTGIVGGVNVGREMDLERVNKVNPYAWSDNQINLTA